MALDRFAPSVFAALVFISLHAIGAAAQATDCAVFDDNRNGSVDTGDMSPLVTEHAVLSECIGTDYSVAIECEALDANGDSRISLTDFDALQATSRLYNTCFGSSVSEQPECGLVDSDGSGTINGHDHAPIGLLFERAQNCLAVDLSVLRCESVDYNADARVTTVDWLAYYDHFADFEACLGARVGRATGLWIDHARLMTLPTSGPAWENLLEEANATFLHPDLSDQNDAANTRTLAKALVGVRLSRANLLEEVRDALRVVTYGATERGARSLAVGRELVAYVIAADLIDLASFDPGLDADFRQKLDDLREMDLSGRTLISTHEDRPNNWGTHAGASRVAIALYLGDEADLAAAAEVHRAWLGESNGHPDFRYGDLAWQANPSRPVGINPRGARRNGIDLDGAQPEEMRRGGALTSPPARTGYAWEALQGATVMTQLLARHGYPDAWSWGDDALRRAVDYLGRLDAAHGGWWATGDDLWIVWLVNHGTGSRYPTQVGVRAGKNLGFTDWTHRD